ncbi:MAG: cytochrome C oxidase subunit IV family protein [Paracoccaceae bacterium]|nr:cytochrome C oxidase subunit IV family protein [Paracoccaceae bacterium]
MTGAHLIRAWLALTAFTALGTVLHFSPMPATVSGSLILLAAGLKARLVLLDYLELRGVPGWSGGILFGLFCFIALLLTLFLAA